MDEVKLLSAVVQDRRAWNILDRFVEMQDLSDRGQVVYKAVSEWYQVDDLAGHVDKDVVLENIVQKHPKHETVFRTIFGKMTEVSTKNILSSFLEFKLAAVGNHLVQAIASKDKAKADALAEQFRALMAGELEVLEKDRKVYTGARAEALVESVRPENLMRLHPLQLNDALGGGLPRGSHTLVFAPPEVGKSMLCINIAAGFLHDGRKVLYIGNEDPAELMLLRFKSRLSGLVRDDILRDPGAADAAADQHGFNNLIFASLSPGTIRDVSGLCDEYKPDVVIVDQLSNLSTPSLSKVEALEWLAKQMRNVCKARNIVGISITQAADSAQGKLVLEMGDVYFSNVAIQAQVDVMIGIGMDQTAEAAGIRMLSLCKNKLNGNHKPVQVQVVPQLSKVK